MGRFYRLFILIMTKYIKTLLINEHIYDTHVIEYMYLHMNTQLLLVKCIYECGQNHGCVKEFRSSSFTSCLPIRKQ